MKVNHLIYHLNGPIETEQRSIKIVDCKGDEAQKIIVNIDLKTMENFCLKNILWKFDGNILKLKSINIPKNGLHPNENNALPIIYFPWSAGSTRCQLCVFNLKVIHH